MSITLLKNTSTLTGLLPQGGPAIPITQPPCLFSGIDVDLEGVAPHQTGVWECTPGKFQRVLPNAEVMHILQGACIFTPSGGQPLQIQAGDTLFFPAHTTGEWHVTETLRKVFFIVAL
ncbi:cupin domain-containing protein (plasmid) [Acidovorax sp. DW039]|uniref:cupin domain-containing protein n=1 Tax=Acidovorax sp. DW039 TaxID=3095606 RepID=UPI0030881832|nr:cupin domain-containing protein [Acidovorax sp. DW039]